MKVKDDSISEVLVKNATSFYIPPFQRAYAWGTHELERYYSDIGKIIESEKNPDEKDKIEHFFGVLVFKTERDGFASREIVVDGQQRITTTLLLLIALRDASTNDDEKTHIENSYLKNTNSTFSEKIKLKTVTNDWDSYKALVQKREPIKGNLTTAYNYFSSRIANGNHSVRNYLDAIGKVNVACVFLDERPYKGEDPQIIFETLNSLGRPLRLSDLIRNFVLLGMSSEEQTNVFDGKWHPKIEKELGVNISHFFRDYLQYKNSKAFKVVSDGNTKELYAQFKDYVKDEFHGDRSALVDDILRYIRLYNWIVTTDSRYDISSDKAKHKEIAELLRNIFHDIGAEAFKPLVLGLLEYHQYGFGSKRLSDAQLVAALTTIRTYLIRRRTMKLAQGENKDIPRLCDKIKGEDLCKDAEATMLQLFANGTYHLRMPNDIEIRSELSRIDFYNGLKSYSKLILGKIEESISKVAVDFRDQRITIEHIIPQSIESSFDWQKELGEEWASIHRRYIHNIGNLILTEFNSEMGNKSFKSKKEQLKGSNLLYRKDVIDYERWQIDAIENHQKKMIDRFIHTFPLPSKMREHNNWCDKQIDARTTTFTFDKLIGENSTRKKPKSITIDGETVDANSWQDVLLSFFRWLESNNSKAFNALVGANSSVASPNRCPWFLNMVNIQETIASNKNRKRYYKRLSDGLLLQDVNEPAEGEVYVYTNLSATNVISTIKEFMVDIGKPFDCVEVEIID